MGLPEINIIFKNLAKTALKRDSQGTVALILKDTTIQNKLFKFESIKDIPEGISHENKEQIELAFKGGYKIPKKVIAYFLSVDGKLQDALNIIETEIWDYLAVPCIEDSEVESVANWIKELREENIKVQAVLPSCKADNEGIINFTTKDIETNDKTYSNKDYCSRIAGILAGTPLNLSATYFVLPEVLNVPHLRRSEANKKIDEGELILINDGEKCKIGRAVNSLTTIKGKVEDFKKIKIVSVMDLVEKDIRTTFENNYAGKYSNIYDNQVIFVTMINNYLDILEQKGLLVKKRNYVEIDSEAMKLVLKKKGIDTDISKQDLEQIAIGSIMFLKGKVRPLDAIEDLTLEFWM